MGRQYKKDVIPNRGVLTGCIFPRQRPLTQAADGYNTDAVMHNQCNSKPHLFLSQVYHYGYHYHYDYDYYYYYDYHYRFITAIIQDNLC